MFFKIFTFKNNVLKCSKKFHSTVKLFHRKGYKMNEINYYKQNEILENNYYQIPQELFVNQLYKEKLNSDNKILYAFLLDRLSSISKKSLDR